MAAQQAADPFVSLTRLFVVREFAHTKTGSLCALPPSVDTYNLEVQRIFEEPVFR